jgi:hypothetical protein
MLLLFLRASKKRKASILVLILLFVAISFAYTLSAKAGGMTSTSNRITNSIPGATNVQYITTFTPASSVAIKCIQIAFTTSTATPSSVPTGLTTTSAAKTSVTASGMTDGNWTLTNTTNGVLIYDSATPETPSGSVVITTGTAIAGITNPSSSGVYYAQIRTYTGASSHICTGQVDYSVVAFATTAGQALSVTVDPSLTFAVANLASSVSINSATTTVDISTAPSNTIPMGAINATTNSIVGQSLTVTTNALNGYVVYASYSGTLTSGGSNTIADHTGTNSSPTSFPGVGTSAFGYTTGSTSLSAGGGGASRFSSNKWAKFEQWGYEVARKSSKASSDVTNVAIQAGVSGTQEAGTYTTTITYVATPLY